MKYLILSIFMILSLGAITVLPPRERSKEISAKGVKTFYNFGGPNFIELKKQNATILELLQGKSPNLLVYDSTFKIRAMAILKGVFLNSVRADGDEGPIYIYP